jgi:hypothetical protein
LAGLVLMLATAHAYARSETHCESGTCKETVCRTDAAKNEVCDVRTYWDKPAAEVFDALGGALPVNSMSTKLGDGPPGITSTPHRLYRPRQPAAPRAPN